MDPGGIGAYAKIPGRARVASGKKFYSLRKSSGLPARRRQVKPSRGLSQSKTEAQPSVRLSEHQVDLEVVNSTPSSFYEAWPGAVASAEPASLLGAL